MNPQRRRAVADIRSETPAGFGSEQVAGFILECMAGFVGIRRHSVALPCVVQHTLRLPYIGKVPVQGRTTKDGV